MSLYLYIFGGVLAVSLVSLIGVFFLAASAAWLKRIIFPLVSFSAGALIGDSFLHLLPEAAEAGEGLGIWLWTIAGLVVFFVLEKAIHWRHCHIPTSREHPHHLGTMNLVGDSLHNFFDGMVIAGSFLISPALGLATLIAVIAHEVPQEIGDFGILMYAGYSRRKAIWYNLLTALTAVVGAAVALMFGARLEGFSTFIVPFTAGGFIYIAVADLIPEMKKETAPSKSTWQLLFIILGVALMLLLKLLFE